MKANKDTLLGIVFFTGLGLILLATAQLKDWTAFEKPFETMVYFPSADGLRAGDAVTVYGMREGRVKSVKINPSQDPRRKRVSITLETKKPIPFQKDTPYEIAIEDSSFLGGKVVTVNPEAPEVKGCILYDKNESLFGVSFSNPLKQVATVFAEGSGDIQGILSGFAKLVIKANSGDSTVGALFNERKLYDSIAEASERLKNIIRDVEAGKGTVGGLVTDKQPFEDLKVAMGDVREATASLNAGKSLLSRVIHDERLGANANNMVEDLRAITENARNGKGTLGKLLKDDDIYQDLREAVQEGKNLLRQAREGKGIIARLISDQTLGNKLAGIVTSLDDIGGTLSRGEGTLGKLLKDDAIYRKLSIVFNQVAGAIEDAREAAPVSTFIQILGSSFR